jgi:hypothetical protein
MPGSTLLRKIQLGKETVAGTAVAATAIWRGMGMLEDQRETVHAEEHVGYLSGVDRTYVPKLLGAISMEAIPATYEQLPYILEAGVKLVNTGAADGSGSDKIYTYTFPITAKNTIKTFTIEGGDDQEVEEMEYAYVDAFTLEGKGGEAWMMSADWLGRQVSLSSFTGALTLPTVAEMLFSNSKLYIDTVSGTMGTTLKSQTLLEASLKVKTGWVPVWTADGALYFSFNKSTAPEILLDVTFEHDSTAAAEKVAWRAQTPRQLRILCEGPTVTTAGTTYSKKTMKIDLVGKWEKFSVLGEQDGNDIVTGTLRARYNATANKFAEIVVVNELTVIP